ncbi:hypothetical protein COX08_04655 [Candidatus Beckwithbacteria bacterium CG23_combo_of_CG06-09_8_20_14_all_34_8]|uniref:DUF2500 domain-containing protein n=1 Tax=Candidatus Beckwithbacteria bacterium CG23_combo_of_CG06-09_8_20_14_all_34_8 TaxID=1974497 RepID=A0A2H0B554_9BACT|nr:MAG: hypothetical protein COX08_04655 [Candidatus Beckwithbacteria bacterium CG23_combo_of_CG06-09_8_20_14_all_34_8]
MNETILTILFVAAVTAFFSYKAYKQKQASWKGELIEKYKKDGDDDSVDQWFVVFKTEAGKKVKMNVGKGFYDQVNVGGKYEKKKGVYVPMKIQ